jgi:hypothetical protein
VAALTVGVAVKVELPKVTVPAVSTKHFKLAPSPADLTSSSNLADSFQVDRAHYRQHHSYYVTFVDLLW